MKSWLHLLVNGQVVVGPGRIEHVVVWMPGKHMLLT